jgi:hypothetical protein
VFDAVVCFEEKVMQQVVEGEDSSSKDATMTHAKAAQDDIFVHVHVVICIAWLGRWQAAVTTSKMMLGNTCYVLNDCCCAVQTWPAGLRR